MDLRQLRHLVVLSRRLNYVRAAEELGITQPSLTRSIQSLERQLNNRLFDRDRGGVALTPLGRLVAERANFLLTDADDLEQHAQLYGQAASGRIRFGMAPMPARALLQHALQNRLTVAPGSTNEVVVRDVEPLWDMLVQGEIEFFVSPNRPLHDLSQARVEHLGTFPLSLIVRANHPLLSGATGQGRFPLLRSSWTGMVVPPEIEPHIFENPNVIEDFETLAGLTANTDAIWLSSAYANQGELATGVFVELLRATQYIEVAHYALRRRNRTPLADAILTLFKERVAALENNDS